MGIIGAGPNASWAVQSHLPALVGLPAFKPERDSWSPRGDLTDDAHQVAELYTAFARDLVEGTSIAPSFRDAVKLHHLVDTIAEASTTGQRKLWQRL